MPPVMGAASFVMAEFLGVPYSHVMLAAAIPAIFYYGALFAAIHFNAVAERARGACRKAELPRLRRCPAGARGTCWRRCVVIFLLLLEGFTATYAALVATLAVVYAWLLGRWVWPLVAGASCSGGSTAPGLAWVALAAAGLVGALARPEARAPCATSCGATARWRCATAPTRRCRWRWRRPPPAS